MLAEVVRSFSFKKCATDKRKMANNLRKYQSRRQSHSRVNPGDAQMTETCFVARCQTPNCSSLCKHELVKKRKKSRRAKIDDKLRNELAEKKRTTGATRMSIEISIWARSAARSTISGHLARTPISHDWRILETATWTSASRKKSIKVVAQPNEFKHVKRARDIKNERAMNSFRPRLAGATS